MSDHPDPDATGAAMFNATLAAVLNASERDRLLRALDPLESERRVAEWQRAIDEAKGEELLSSEAIAERHREWKRKHPHFDPLFEPVRTDAEGRTAR